MLTIERRRTGDDQALFEGYREVFGQELTESSRRRWRWQYLESPASDPQGPEIWVAREDGSPLGQYASMPVSLWWDGREVRASWGMDVFLRPEARGKGIGAQLFTAWSDHVEVALGLGLTPSSYGLFQKLRYRDVGPVPFFQRILDPAAVATRRLGSVLGPVGGLGLRAWLAATHPVRARRPRRITVRRVTSFGADYDALWERARGSYAMCVRRDAAYLTWKYLACPTQSYEIHEARQGQELCGFAVSRQQDYRGLRLGWILDVFAEAGDGETKDALLFAVLDAFRKAGVARVQAFSMNRALADDLRRHGFLPGRSPMQFCVRSRVASGAVFEELGRWHVVFGDSDMDR